MFGSSVSTQSNSLAPNPKPSTSTIKFLCSYGGKILPRHPDGKLRYHGGHTRVLAVHRSISFSELRVKLVELCGASVSLRCQLPKEDLDALVSITSDEDLANLIEEYDRAFSPPISYKIRAFLFSHKSIKKAASPPPSSSSSPSSSFSSSYIPDHHSTSPKSYNCYQPSPGGCCMAGSTSSRSSPLPARRCIHQNLKPMLFYPACYDYEKSVAGRLPHQYAYYVKGNTARVCVIPNGNHWQ